MMTKIFSDRLTHVLSTGDALTILNVSPKLLKLPLPMKRYDDPFLPFGKVLIKASQNRVRGYMFDFPAYLALGAAGAVALERTIAYVRSDYLTILNGLFADKSYYQLADDTAFNVDAMTFIEEPDVMPDRLGVFVLDGGKLGRYISQTSTLEYLLNGKRVSLRIAGDEVVYSDTGDDFINKFQQALDQFNGH